MRHDAPGGPGGPDEPGGPDAGGPADAETVAAPPTDWAVCRGQTTAGQSTEGRRAEADGTAPAAIWDAIASRIEHPIPRDGSDRPWPGTSAPRPTGRRSAHRAGIIAGTASATVAVAVIVVLGVEVDHLRHRVSRLSADTDAGTLAVAARHALVDPRSRRITLTGTGSANSPRPRSSRYLLVPRSCSIPGSWHYRQDTSTSSGPLSIVEPSP